MAGVDASAASASASAGASDSAGASASAGIFDVGAVVGSVEKMVGDAVDALFGIAQPAQLPGAVGLPEPGVSAATTPDPGGLQAPQGLPDGSPTGTPAAPDAPMYHSDVPTPEK